MYIFVSLSAPSVLDAKINANAVFCLCITFLKASSIQYEGTFYKFMFETGLEQEKLFAPVFSVATTKDPLSGKEQELEKEFSLLFNMRSERKRKAEKNSTKNK